MSIILGFIVFVFLYFSILLMMGIGVIAVLSLTVFLTALVISGFIATYFTIKKKIYSTVFMKEY